MQMYSGQRIYYFPPDLFYIAECSMEYAMFHCPPLAAAYRIGRDEDGWRHAWVLPDMIRDEAFRIAEGDTPEQVWDWHFSYHMIMAGKYKGEY